MRRDPSKEPATPGKAFGMTKDTETIPGQGSPRSHQEHAPPRKPYSSPCLEEWGSILELTRGEIAGFDDADFGASSPV